MRVSLTGRVQNGEDCVCVCVSEKMKEYVSISLWGPNIPTMIEISDNFELMGTFSW